MDCIRHDSTTVDDHAMHQTSWRLADAVLQATWREPATLLAVSIARGEDRAGMAAVIGPSATLPLALPWLACELASRQLPLTDPLQIDLADAMLALRETLMGEVDWQDCRPVDESRVTRLHPARPLKA